MYTDLGFLTQSNVIVGFYIYKFEVVETKYTTAEAKILLWQMLGTF